MTWYRRDGDTMVNPIIRWYDRRHDATVNPDVIANESHRARKLHDSYMAESAKHRTQLDTLVDMAVALGMAHTTSVVGVV